MSGDDSLSRILDNHQLYNRYQVIFGVRQTTGGTSPSLYIMSVKLKKVLKALTDIEIENVYDKEMTPYNCRIHRDKLDDKINTLNDWQLKMAVDLLEVESGYVSMRYVRFCKRTDKKPIEE
jgi:hypothetical protein